METKIIGAFEEIDFPQFGIKSIIAKIDSGAYSGALHATNIREEETPDGMVLRFSPFDYPDIKIAETDYEIAEVKSSNGRSERRYFITTTILLAEHTYDIVLSLADRSNMKWPVLIGRRFLSKHSLILDVNKTSINLIRKVKSKKVLKAYENRNFI
jgi:hypothetical protein